MFSLAVVGLFALNSRKGGIKRKTVMRRDTVKRPLLVLVVGLVFVGIGFLEHATLSNVSILLSREVDYSAAMLLLFVIGWAVGCRGKVGLLMLAYAVFLAVTEPGRYLSRPFWISLNPLHLPGNVLGLLLLRFATGAVFGLFIRSQLTTNGTASPPAQPEKRE